MSSSVPNTMFDLSLLEMFRSELETHARVLDQGLVTAEAAQSPQTLEPLMRAAHSIKGAARMMGLDRAVRLAHAMEDLLAAAQRGTSRLTATHVDKLLRSNDVFLRAAKAAPSAIPAELEQQSEAIDRLVDELTSFSSIPAAVPAVAAEAIKAVAAEPAAPQTTLAAPTQVLPAPASAAPLSVKTGGPPGQPPAAAEDQSVRVRAESLNRLVGLAGECFVQTRFTPMLTSSVQRIHQLHAAAAVGLGRTSDLLQEGDISAAQNELERSLELFRQARDLVPKFLLDFDEWTRRMERLVDPLYAEAIASRMRPFSDTTHGFPRMVRDLAKNLGKKVHFEIEGTSTPVDRDILERLEAPLTHLLRNSLDHGIELPTDRVGRGKPEEGRLLLSAHQVSGMLRIAVTDDGAGINLPLVRKKVTDGGYLSEEMARNLSEAEIMEFLFLPGFSTAHMVTEVSGRGVGLDVVRSAVRAVGGSVHIQSTPGAGSTFELQLPLTLSIMRSLLVEAGGQIYAIPLTRIDRLLRITVKDLEVLEDRQFCTVDGQRIGVLDAAQVLDVRPSDRSENISVVVITDRLNRYGLAVDRFLGQRDLAIKPLPACLGKVRNISGGAILDDGTPALILDADDLVCSMDSLLSHGTLRKVTAPVDSARPHVRRRVLVVDDSITVREVERRLLENSGYEVVVAVDGMDGWNQLQRASFDLLVTDVDMPRIDGLELVRRVRSAPRTAGMPVVIVSYKEQTEHRMAGMEAGANYYLTKSSFHDESLVSAVRDLIGEA